MDGKWENRLYLGKPYKSGEQPKIEGLSKLNSNENPYPPSGKVMGVLAEFASGGAMATKLERYPPADGGALREALAKYHNVGTENVFVCNGSDEALAFAFRGCFLGDGKLLFPDLTYSFYPVWCELFGIPYECAPLGEDFRVNTQDYTGRNARGIVLCNPNAPTGVLESEGLISEVLEGNKDCLVLVDEAYAEFSGYTAIPFVREYENLLITRSFSKSRSLAGLRIGYAVGSEKLIATLMAVKDSFNSYPIDAVAIAAGGASLGDEPYYRETLAKVVATRERTAEALRGLGFDVPESGANFLFAGCGSAERAQAIFAFLREKNILVRYFALPRCEDRLRISIGTDAQMDELLKRLKEFAQ